MSKERLEEIKEHLHQIRSVLGLVGDQETVNRAGELAVLIDEQAERVEELEEENKALYVACKTMDESLEIKDAKVYSALKSKSNYRKQRNKLNQQNKRYREAIEKAIRNLAVIEGIAQIDMVIDRLNKALEGES